MSMAEATNPTNGMPSPWSDEREELLRRLWDNGLSASLIALELGDMTRNAVIGKAARLGLPSRPSTSFLSRMGWKQMVDRDRSLTQRMRGLRRERRTAQREVKETPPAVEFLGVKLLDLEYRQCRYPRGEGANITFCGQVTSPGKSFCPHCCRIVYRVAA